MEVRVPIPPLDAADAKFEGSPAAWGNRCFAHLEAERLDAAEAACFAGLLAGGSNGRSHVEPPPLVVRAAIPARHPDDARFDGSAKAWGNRCLEHLQAERLDAAEAACYAGLLVRATRGTRGALTYNLGRIAQARGDRERARAYYERSQELRPHEATTERLRALGGT